MKTNRKWTAAGLSALFVCAGLLAGAETTALTDAIARDHQVKKTDDFYGGRRTVFDFEGYEAWIVEPPQGVKVADGKPWTWVMQWSTAFVPRTGVPQVLRRGFHHVTIDTYRHRMDAAGVAVSRRFQDYLVKTLGFAPRARLIGMSWGGFFSIRYAAYNPGCVESIYLDAPLLSLDALSWTPSRGSIQSWFDRTPAGGAWATDPEMPINMADRIAADGIPVLLLYGGQDQTVVPSKSCEIFAERFKRFGGDIEVVNRSLFGHHPHGVEVDDPKLADFYSKKTRRAPQCVKGAGRERLSGQPGARFSLAEARCTGQWMCVVDPGPRMSYTTGDGQPDEKTGLWKFSFAESANGVTPGVHGTLRTTFRPDGKVVCDYTLTATKPEPVRDFYFSFALPNQPYAGGRVVADGKGFPLAAEWAAGKTPGRPVSGTFSRADIYDRKGILRLTLEFAEPTQISLCDCRSWGASGFDLRLPLGALATFVKGETRKRSFVLSAPGGLKDSFVKRVIEAGREWTPFRFDREIEAGSACDFSSQLPLDAPSGKHGWIVARGEDFEFENLPGVKQRFYGNNISWSVPQSTRERSAKLAREFVRTGYNAMRLHYWDIMMTDGVPDGTTIPEERLRAFDGFMKELIDAGIYVTTDLYTSRRIPYRTLGIDRTGFVPMDEFKERLLVCEAAVRNLEDYVRQLLTHRNVYTGRDYAHEPALAWYCIVNEGNPGNFGFTYAKDIPEFRTEWVTWLKAKKAADAAYADIPEDFPKGPMALDRHGAAYRQFLAFLARRLDTRMKAFVRSLGSKALVTSMNAWNNPMSYQLVREDVYDFVDDHFYVDHPHFASGRSYPTSCAGLNPVADGCAGVPGVVSRRLLSKPFTVTEYNYSWPGRYRGAGGLLMGSFAALQNWSALWRFCFGKDGAIVDDPNVALLRFHDTWADPMMRASEYPFAALFLRGDLKPLAARTPVTLARKDVEKLQVEPVASSRFPWSRLAWYSRVGTLVDAPAAPGDFHPRAYPAAYAADTSGKVRAELFPGSAEDAPLPPTADGAVRLDEEKGTLAVATEKTCGVFLERGSLKAGVLDAAVDSPATVWVVSCDGRPLTASKRLLVGHLTDALQAGTAFLGEDVTCLMGHGRIGELLVRNGKATVALGLPKGDCRVYALSSGGRRLAEIATQRNGAGQLVFEANVARDPKLATYLYEVVRCCP